MIFLRHTFLRHIDECGAYTDELTYDTSSANVSSFSNAVIYAAELLSQTPHKMTKAPKPAMFASRSSQPRTGRAHRPPYSLSQLLLVLVWPTHQEFMLDTVRSPRCRTTLYGTSLNLRTCKSDATPLKSVHLDFARQAQTMPVYR
eukprot:1059884-Amphidinium_carterae.2